MCVRPCGGQCMLLHSIILALSHFKPAHLSGGGSKGASLKGRIKVPDAG